MFGRRPQDHRDIGDPAASGRDNDTLPRLHAAVQVQTGQLDTNLVADVRHPRPGELLAKTKDLRKAGHVLHAKTGWDQPTDTDAQSWSRVPDNHCFYHFPWLCTIPDGAWDVSRTNVLPGSFLWRFCPLTLVDKQS